MVVRCLISRGDLQLNVLFVANLLGESEIIWGIHEDSTLLVTFFDNELLISSLMSVLL